MSEFESEVGLPFGVFCNCNSVDQFSFTYAFWEEIDALFGELCKTEDQDEVEGYFILENSTFGCDKHPFSIEIAFHDMFGDDDDDEPTPSVEVKYFDLCVRPKYVIPVYVSTFIDVNLSTVSKDEYESFLVKKIRAYLFLN